MWSRWGSEALCYLSLGWDDEVLGVQDAEGRYTCLESSVCDMGNVMLVKKRQYDAWK